MPITNDAELQQVTQRITRDLQDVQDYLGRTNHPDGKFRFPRGYLRQAYLIRDDLSYMTDSVLRRNIGYAHIMSDLYLWLLSRTAIMGTGREMIIKEAICLAGGIAESLTKSIGIQLAVSGKQTNFRVRCERLVAAGVITEELSAELQWLWGIRQNEHLFLVESIEYQTYELEDYARAADAVRTLKQQLRAYFDGLPKPEVAF